MEITLLIKTKAWLTVALGAAFLIIPNPLISAMGGTLNDVGTIMAQLFGLVAISAGWGMAVSNHPAPAGSEALVVAASDVIALGLLVMAAGKGVLGGPAYGLAAVYAGSAALYFYFYLYSRRLPQTPGDIKRL